MAYIKWKRRRPFVYRSERTTIFEGIGSETIEKTKVRSVYLGSYRKYRENKPNGTFDSLVKPETRLKWMAKHPERLTYLHLIDEEIYKAFEGSRK